MDDLECSVDALGCLGVPWGGAVGGVQIEIRIGMQNKIKMEMGRGLDREGIG